MNSISKFKAEGIFCKFDWYSCIFRDFTFNQALEFLGLDPTIYVSEFLAHKSDYSRGAFDMISRFSYEGVGIEANYYDVLSLDSDSIFTTPFKAVKIDISGSGLDFLRSANLDPDYRLRDFSIYPENFNVTRCDFAFDLVNYQSNFIDELINYCETNCTPSGNVTLLHCKGAVKCSLRKIDQKTVYLGSTKGMRLLRVYDKKMECIDRNTGCYVKDNPYSNPDSWIRIELQTRRDEAMRLLFGKADNYFLSVFRYIFDTYCFSNYADSTKDNRKPAQFWFDLFDWERIPAIIQNENSVQFITLGERTIRDVGCQTGRLIKWLAVLYKQGGRTAVQKLIDDHLLHLFDYDDLSMSRPRNNFINTLNVLSVEGSIDIHDGFENCECGLYRDHGVINFKF